MRAETRIRTGDGKQRRLHLGDPRPAIGTETVKLNYGYDFTTGAREYPHGEIFKKPLPDTWLKMDAVLAYWQEMGVDGFRCDMAHMVPPEFWAWAIGRAAGAGTPEVCFLAEAYDNDPAKVGSGSPLFQALDYGRGNVMFDLLSAGFDAVYDDPSYKKLKSIYEGSCWANDLDGVFPHDPISSKMRCATPRITTRCGSQTGTGEPLATRGGPAGLGDLMWPGPRPR